MSDLTGLIAVSALCVASSFPMFYVARMANEWADQIVTGFIRDHPIPTTQRWLMLYTRWVSALMGAVALPSFLAIAAVFMADHVDHADTRLLAYLLAFLLAIASGIWLILGSVQFVSYRSLVHQAEAD